MATFLVAHGAWSAGWAWKRMHPILRSAGHVLLTPSYTGLGERGHLASPAIDLEMHVRDLLLVLEYEDLRDVVLIGHSYGGMVATGVADRAADRLARLIYLDAFVPRDGQSMFDLLPPRARDRMREQARVEGEGWRVPPTPIPPDTDPADLPWLNARRMPQPLATFEQPLRLTHGETALPRSYVYCTRIAPGDVFRPFAERSRQETGWRAHDLDASHSPNVTAPGALARLLETILAS
jgi:pimeloyl-ACP methyl ester carboxylesterase